MSDLQQSQEIAVKGLGWLAAIGAAIAAYSKIAKGYSSDRHAVAKETTAQALYTLLLEENKRYDERNKALEIRNENMSERLNKLEVVHARILAVEQENKNLKTIIARKDVQLLTLLQQQKTDREQWEAKLSEITTSSKRRIDDIQGHEKLDFKEH